MIYSKQTPAPQPVIEATASTGADEASKIAAMFANTDEQWKTTQEKMSTLVLYPYSIHTCQSLDPDDLYYFLCYRTEQHIMDSANLEELAHRVARGLLSTPLLISRYLPATFVIDAVNQVSH